ncbi:endoribonuclease Dicer-like [Haemaphysalis longicornis]
MKKKKRSEMSGTGHDKAREDMDNSDSSHSRGPSSVRLESVPSKVASGFYRWSMPVPREQWDPRDKKLLEAVKPMEEVEDILGYSFRDKGFLLVAFTHESFPASARVVPGCMRPMDFMGDALLKFLLSAQLYGCVHPLTSGKLTQTRQQLECNRFFAFLTAHLGMHRLLRCGSPALSDDIVSYVKEIKGKEEPPSEPKCPPKPLADLFEALACAVYFDSGQDLATVWRSVFPNLRPHIESHVGSLSGHF